MYRSFPPHCGETSYGLSEYTFFEQSLTISNETKALIGRRVLPAQKAAGKRGYWCATIRFSLLTDNLPVGLGYHYYPKVVPSYARQTFASKFVNNEILICFWRIMRKRTKRTWKRQAWWEGPRAEAVLAEYRKVFLILSRRQVWRYRQTEYWTTCLKSQTYIDLRCLKSTLNALSWWKSNDVKPSEGSWQNLCLCSFVQNMFQSKVPSEALALPVLCAIAPDCCDVFFFSAANLSWGFSRAARWGLGGLLLAPPCWAASGHLAIDHFRQ